MRALWRGLFMKSRSGGRSAEASDLALFCCHKKKKDAKNTIWTFNACAE